MPVLSVKSQSLLRVDSPKNSVIKIRALEQT